MAIDAGILRSRRALLAGGIGGLVAVVASAIGRPSGEVRATAGEDLVLGKSNYSIYTTSVLGTATDVGSALLGPDDVPLLVCTNYVGDGIRGTSPVYPGSSVGGAGTGVEGVSVSGKGVLARSTSGTGLYAQSTSGVGAIASSVEHDGVRGASTGANRSGVYGRSNHVDGFGVFGGNAPSGNSGSLGSRDAGVAGVSGSGDGVRGRSGAASKSGVYGVATNAAGFGVYGSNGSSQDVGYLGGQGVGVHGQSIGGVGVRGQGGGAGVLGVGSTGPGVRGTASGTKPAVTGEATSTSGVGVYGTALAASGATYGVAGTSASAAGTGVLGFAPQSGTGLLGVSGGNVPATAAKTGVYGRATQDDQSRGVYGYSTAGQGVRGQATTGTAGFFSTPVTRGLHTGVALRAVGRVKFDKCTGIATVPSGATSILVTPGIELEATSGVVATVQGNVSVGCLVERVAVDAAANTFTIHLSSPSTGDAKAAWQIFG